MTIKKSATKNGKSITIEIDDRIIQISVKGGKLPVLDKNNPNQEAKSLHFSLTVSLYEPKITHWTDTSIEMIILPKFEFTAKDKQNFALGLIEEVMPFIK